MRALRHSIFSTVTQPDKRGAYATADGKPRIQPSVVAFLDILGFAEQIKAADKQGRSNELLQRLTTLLEDWSGHSGTLRDQSSESDQRSWEVKTFTDNVVVAHPLYYDDDNGEAELGRFKSSLSLLQIAFAFDGFFVRGGIAVGDVYVDDTLIYGKALLDAYEAAEKKADWPRIVFAPSAIEYLHKHLRYYGSVSSAPHNRHVFIDNDDQWVLDYLGDVWQDRTEPPPL